MESAQRAVLFVDVSDSTRIYESLGDTVALALINGLFARLEAVLAKHAGSIVKSLGDGIICVFDDPDHAFRAACEIQSSVRSAAQGTHNRLQLKIGFTWGPVILSKGDVFGDTMNVCARLVTLANPEQILTSAQTVEALSAGLRTRCRALFPTRIKGRAEEVAVSEVLWSYDPAITASNLTRAAFARAVQTSLKLIYRGNIFVVGRSRPTLQFGRDAGNDVVIASLFASRIHARVTTRDGHFVLTDLSSNGTFLLPDEEPGAESNVPPAEIHLRREEAVLAGRGWIGMGKHASRHGDHSVRYSLQQENL
jgi:adenylate cyclase